MVKEVFGVARKIPAYAPVIRYLRETHHMSRQQLASRLAVQDYYIGYMEDGYRYPRARQIQMLSHIFQWSPFELALLTDVEIPYPDWPPLEDLSGWLALASQWISISDTIHRYTLAKSLMAHPTWLQDLYRVEPALEEALKNYGFVAIYGYLRDRWQPVKIPVARTTLPHSLQDVIDALSIDASTLSSSAVSENMPKWWKRLSARQKSAVEAVALTIADTPPTTTD